MSFASKKRTRNSSSPQLDYKKVKQHYSVSSSEGDSSFVETLEEVTEDIKSVDMESLERKLVSLMDQMKLDMLQEIRKTVEDAVQQSMQGVESRLEGLEAENKSLKEEIKTLKAEVINSTKAVQIAQDSKAHAVRNEQYSRRTSIRIFGVKENQNEDSKQLSLDIFRDKLGLTFTKRDLNAAHRVGLKKPEQTRALLVQFVNKDDRYTVMKERKRLKGTRITLVDDLTKEVHQLFNRVKNDSRIMDAWTWEGQVKFKTRDGKIRRVDYGQSLDQLIGAA